MWVRGKWPAHDFIRIARFAQMRDHGWKDQPLCNLPLAVSVVTIHANKSVQKSEAAISAISFVISALGILLATATARFTASAT